LLNRKEGKFQILKKKYLNGDLPEIARRDGKGIWTSEKCDRNDDGVDQDPKIVDGKNAVHSTHVKRAKVMRRIARVDEDSADEESGKDKKEIDAAPTDVCGCKKVAEPWPKL